MRGNLLLLLRNNYGSTIYYVAVQCTISGDTLWDMTRGVSFAMKVRIFSAASVSWLIVHLEFWNGWEELHFWMFISCLRRYCAISGIHVTNVKFLLMHAMSQLRQLSFCSLIDKLHWYVLVVSTSWTA